MGNLYIRTYLHRHAYHSHNGLNGNVVFGHGEGECCSGGDGGDVHAVYRPALQLIFFTFTNYLIPYGIGYGLLYPAAVGFERDGYGIARGGGGYFVAVGVGKLFGIEIAGCNNIILAYSNKAFKRLHLVIQFIDHAGDDYFQHFALRVSVFTYYVNIFGGGIRKAAYFKGVHALQHFRFVGGYVRGGFKLSIGHYIVKLARLGGEEFYRCGLLRRARRAAVLQYNVVAGGNVFFGSHPIIVVYAILCAQIQRSCRSRLPAAFFPLYDAHVKPLRRFCVRCAAVPCYFGAAGRKIIPEKYGRICIGFSRFVFRGQLIEIHGYNARFVIGIFLVSFIIRTYGLKGFMLLYFVAHYFAVVTIGHCVPCYGGQGVQLQRGKLRPCCRVTKRYGKGFGSNACGIGGLYINVLFAGGEPRKAERNGGVGGKGSLHGGGIIAACGRSRALIHHGVGIRGSGGGGGKHYGCAVLARARGGNKAERGGIVLDELCFIVICYTIAADGDSPIALKAFITPELNVLYSGHTSLAAVPLHGYVPCFACCGIFPY